MLKTMFVTAWCSLLLPLFTCAQTIKKDISFSVVDSVSRTIRYKTDIYRLTKELTDPYTEQTLKVRAIFIWITDNIRYDYKFINKEKEIKIPECTSEANCEEIYSEWEKSYLKKVIKKKKAICDGYARLFKKMCEISGITCEIVPGYSRTKPYQIGNAGSVDHAWNAVWVDSAYHFVDPTWAAGGCAEDEETGKLLPFRKRFNNYYWFTSFDDLSRNHYPKDDKWVFTPGYTKEIYAANPYYTSDVIGEIKLLSPASGIIKARQGDTIHFKFAYKESINRLQVNSDIFRNPDIWEWKKISWRYKMQKVDTVALKQQRYIPFKKNADTYEFDYIVTGSSLYYLEILFDYRKVMRFHVEIDKR
jgi:Transglutaminase-like superfamily